MIDRGNGTRASKAVSARARREALLRKALLGSTALIGITLATPAMAQSINPAGGGTISGTGSYTDATATNGGVQVTNTDNAGITMSGVTINNITGDPNGIAYKQIAAGGQSAVLFTAGANALRSDQNGAALSLQAANGNVTWAIGQFDTASTTDLAATFGAYLIATGFINVVDFGTVSSLRNVTGIAGDTGIYASSNSSSVNLSLKAPTISGFVTGINALSTTGANVTTTGGSISTLAGGTGIRASATSNGGAVTISSGSAITTSGTGTGISATSNNATTSVTTTSGGTINGGKYGIQVNAALAGQSTTVTIGAAIGDTTRPTTAAVDFTSTGVVGGTNTVNVNANVSGGTGFYTIGSSYTNTDLIVNVAPAVTVTGQSTSTIRAGRNVTVVNNGTISAPGAGSTAIGNAQAPSLIDVTNSGTITGGSFAISALGGATVTNAGTISAANNVAIDTGRGGTITNNTGGTIAGGSNATNGWAIRFNSSTFSTGQTVSNNATITGGAAGAIRLDAVTASTLNLNAGSTTTGLVKVSGTGATTTNLAGNLNGDYDASGASGTQNFTLAATGSAHNVTLGSGNDVFTWGGGAFTGTIDGGTGADTFQVDVGASTVKTLNLATDFANIINFDAFTLLSGRLTLTGSRDGGAGWAVAGGNATELTVNGALTNIAGNAVTLLTADQMFVLSGAQLSATGDVIYSTAIGNNISNAGTITAGTGMSSGIAIGSGTITNGGTITYAAGGSIATQGNGVLGISNQLTVTNNAGASIIGRWDGVRANNGIFASNYGLIRGDRFAGMEINGGSTITNYGTGRIYGATGEGAGILINSGVAGITNASGGQIVGAGIAAIYNGGTGLLTVSNSGTIATGTLDGTNNYVAGGIATAIRSGSAYVTNSGAIEGASGGILTTGALTLYNTGTINGFGTGLLSNDAVNAGGVATIVNSGSIAQGSGAAIHAGAGGTITNATGGALIGGNDATTGAAVQLIAGGTFNNYGAATSTAGIGVINGNTAATINLFAGSSIGKVISGSGNDTLAIYNGGSASDAAITDGTSGITLRNAGALTTAIYGAIDLGGGNDTIQLRGTGTGAQAGTFSLANATGVETISKLDSGTWTINGTATAPGISVIAGNGGPSGTLILSGTSGIGSLYVNGANVQANGGGAISGATVHMLAGNLQLAFASVYANNILLDVGTPLNGQASVFENLFGGNATLSGNITSGSGTNIGGQAIASSQALTFAGLANSVFNLTGTNSWTGITTINSGVTLQGSTNSISGGSIVDNGTLTYSQGTSGTIAQAISGTGALVVTAGGAVITLTGANTFTGGTTLSGSGANLVLGAGGQLAGNVVANANATLTFNRGDGYTFATSASGAGAVTALGTATLSGAFTNTGAFTVNSTTNGVVTLTGSRSGATGSGVVYTGMSSTFRVGSGGTVAGGDYLGVRMNGSNGTLANLGTITNAGTLYDNNWGAAVGVGATSGTTTVNNGDAGNSLATISGQNAGISHLGSGGVIATGLLTVNNYGTISSAIKNGIDNQAGSGALTVNNYAGGYIVGQGSGGAGAGVGNSNSSKLLTITNGGWIVGRTSGVSAFGSLNLTNSGTIASGTLSGGTSGTLTTGTGAGVIALNAAGSAITNQANGLITGNVGISASGNGLQLVNQNGAVIRGATSGISANGTITIDNSGTIETLSGAAGYGIRAGTGSTITNNLGGIIRQAGTGGMYTISASDTLTLVNAGTISNASTALFTAAVDATQTLTLTNSGTITAAGGAAVQLNGGDNVIANSGTITGGSDANFGFGVYATADSWNTTITNQAGGVIGGSRGGVRVDSADGIAIDNAGTLVGTAAISSGVFILNGDPTLTNRAGGTIVGQSWGIQSDDTGTITNAGFIGSGTLSGGTTGSFTVNAGGNAIAMSGGSVTNDATGSIVGGNYGITADGPMTIVNSGLISGGSHAIYLTGTGNNIVTLNAGSTTTGAIQLGDGGDTLNWNGGSFTSINGGAGHDVFNANLGAGSTTLNVATLSGFETYNQNGGALTLAGIQGAGGGWTVNGGALTLGANAKVDVTGTGVTLADGGTSITIINGGALIGNAGNGVVATADTSVTNGGMIRSHGTSYAGVTTDGGTIHNQAAGLIAADGTGVVMQAGGTTLSNAGIILGKVDGVVGGDVSQTLVNTNIIAVGDAGNNVTQFWQVNQNYSTGDGVRFTAGGSVTNSGIIAGGANGVAISGGAATIENSSSMIGYSGYGLLLDAAAGTTSTIVNHMSGSMEGGQGAVLLTGDGTVNLTNEIGSYMYGSIVSTGGGARNIDLSGTVYGDYDASASTGANTVTFRSGAHINNVTLGSGDDTFIYFGGIIDGVVDGGGGHDSLFADFGVGTSYNVSLANFIGFESLGLISGDMTLTGPSNNPGQAIYAGLGGVPSGTITFDGTSDLTGDIYVNGGAIRAATAGAFGSGTIHMIDPTATFGATGTYANNISLEVAAPSSANPSTLNTDAGVIATLTGAITTGTGAGVDPNQDLVFGGTGTVILTNAGNSWTGTTTINHGATLQGSAAAISGSAIVNNGELVYDEAGNSIVVANITGSGNFHKIGSGSLTLTGTNSWTGNTEIGGGWLIGTTDSISGSTLNFNGGNLAFVQAANGTFAADMSGSGYVNVWAGGNTLTFSGHNAFTGSINVQDASTVAITGTLNTGTANSINLYNAGAGVTNSGTISGARAVEGGVAGVLVNNLAGGTITGNAQSAVMLWQGGTVTNAGTINNGNGQATIYMAGANGSVTNSANAIIQNSVGNALNINSANFTLDNAGTIQGIHTAVAINSGTSASVTNSGLISGANYGIRAATAGATIVNSGSGTITATGGPAAIAVFLTGDNASVTNQAGASITGAGYGVFISGTNGAVTNNGAIIVNAGTGASLSNGGVITNAGAISAGTTGSGIGLGVYAGGAATVTNQSGGTISGGNLAMLLAGSDLVTVNLNAGSTTTGLIASAGNGARAINIFGKLDGNYEGSDGADLITLDTGATLTGWLDGGAGNDTLALVGSGSATLGTVRNIESATKSGTGTWTIATPTGIGAWTITDGTLVLAGGNAIADTASVAVNGGTVRLAASEAIGSLSGTGIVALGANTLGLTSGGSTFTGTLTGTTGNLLIDGANFTFGGTAGYGGLTEVRSGGLTLAAGASFNPASTLLVGTAGTLNLANVGMTVSQAKLQGVLNGSGTLTASIIELDGATVNANLAGPVTNSGGISTLNGMVVGANVAVTGGTLRLGAGERIADTANLSVAQGATFDLQGFNETVALASLAGTLAGTGTLTASEYDLAGATVNANLGAGTVYSTGASKLNGTAAGNVAVNGGTLTLGASNRLADTATVAVASGATLDIGAFSDTIGTLGLGGTLAGTGTLTAGQYQLTGATVNANLGNGTLFNLGGTSVLNGTAAGDVSVQAGTLTLGAANRIADTATLNVGTGATFNLGNFNETVGLAGIAGTLAGTGTLTAGQYQLTGATVNANLGNGALFNLGGTSVLNGTAAATNVTVQAGTLRLGASDRLADSATLGVASGATFDLAGYNETVASLAGSGTVALGTGRLTLSSAANTAFGGAITGSGTIDKQGIGTLTLAGTFATTGRFDVSAGTLAFSGSTQGGIRVQGGTLTGGGTLAGPLTIASGTFSPGGLAGAPGAINPIGNFTVGSLVVSGGTLLFDFGGTGFNFASDSIKVNGAATLTGGTVQVNALTSAASDYRFNQLYTIVQANTLTGTFANGSVFATVASNPNLKWRLRYDLLANAVVLQVQKNMEFNDGIAAGDRNTLAVANALGSSTTGNASDQWSATLNTITSLDTQQRVAAFRSLSGEILANASSATISANNQFTDLLRQRVGDGSDALIGGGFAGSSLADVRTTATAGNGFASSLAGASLPGAGDGEAGNGGIWGQVYGGYQKLVGDGVHAGVDNTVAGVAMGLETRTGGLTAGIAGGVAQIDSDMNSRSATMSGNQYQLGGYLSYDAGSLFVAASGSWYSSDLNSRRTLALGTTTALATGDIHATGYSVGVSGGFRTELGNGLRLALIGSANKVRNQQDGFAESAAGGLGLQMASANRDLFTAGAELRLGAKVKTGAGVAMPWVSMGVRYNSGDLDTVGALRFSGAPSGTGGFGIEGVRMAPVLGTLGVGIDARASRNVRLGIALEGSAGENTREGRASVRVKIGF